MTFEEVKEYIGKIINNEKFKKLAEFTHMLDMDSKKDAYENIQYYLEKAGKYQKETMKMTRKENGTYVITYEPDYDYFIRFLDFYLREMPTKVHNSKGFIDLNNTLYLEQPRMFLTNKGFFLDSKMIFTNGDLYFSKIPIHMKNSEIHDNNCIYCPLIASHIAKVLQVEAPDIDLAVGSSGPRILSKNFLKPNEEILTYSNESDEIKISEQLSKLEECLKSRRFPKDEIEKAKLDFLKQEFVAKLIGLKDQTSQNSQIIVTIDENGGRHVRVAPMHDLDFSFHIGEKTQLSTRKCDNGKIDIESLIEQYREYPGFMEYVRNAIQDFNMPDVFKRIYEDTGITCFKDYSTDENIIKFANFVNKNLQMARATIEKSHKQGSEGR